MRRIFTTLEHIALYLHLIRCTQKLVEVSKIVKWCTHSRCKPLTIQHIAALDPRGPTTFAPSRRACNRYTA